ncbi:hypothetical protein LELG_04552 [Lodderomyces elongisporus NRRL YB-4239]|uniref:Endonuclease/exonuclease/phosphatase domain-containing protein n=1 Tax=Lodderomyces elongisporus (strain ATCC 11503 / CBS 2605 / JCM 1781 / NBRC 1676 / NRRL YB-4239) TaxID=379508 RepID=A5E4L3_LODEL|nr:hypothetical protein LELG_04552 [Lodderomyces elongisporus NRRL YB-4239]
MHSPLKARRRRFILIISLAITLGFLFLLNLLQLSRSHDASSSIQKLSERLKELGLDSTPWSMPDSIENNQEEEEEDQGKDGLIGNRVKQDYSKGPKNQHQQKLTQKELEVLNLNLNLNLNLDLEAKKNPHKYLGGTRKMDTEEKLKYQSGKQLTLLGVPQKDQDFEPVTIPKPVYKTDVSTNFNLNPIKPLRFRIYSHNIKNGGNRPLTPGESLWNDRVHDLAMSMKFHITANTIITLQELYKYQVLDIMNYLNLDGDAGVAGGSNSDGDVPTWDFYGVGRIDGAEYGEFAPIIYNTKEWELVYSDTIWLNEIDTRISYEGWDALYPRICSYITLRHRELQNVINVFNTHFDHIGKLARKGSAKLIMDTVQDLQKQQCKNIQGNHWPAFIMGDLNAEPKEESIKILKDGFVDSVTLATSNNKYGHTKSTVTGFEGEVLLNGGQNIDYIFAPKYAQLIDDVKDKVDNKAKSNKEKKEKCDELKKSNAFAERADLTLLLYGMLHSRFNGRYMSDHRPLLADYYISNKCL